MSSIQILFYSSVCCLTSNALISDSYRKSHYFIKFSALISHLGTLATKLVISAKNKCYMLV